MKAWSSLEQLQDLVLDIQAKRSASKRVIIKPGRHGWVGFGRSGLHISCTQTFSCSSSLLSPRRSFKQTDVFEESCAASALFVGAHRRSADQSLLTMLRGRCDSVVQCLLAEKRTTQSPRNGLYGPFGREVHVRVLRSGDTWTNETTITPRSSSPCQLKLLLHAK